MSKRVHLFNDDPYVDDFIENIAKYGISDTDIFYVISDKPLHYVKSKNIEIITLHNQEDISKYIENIKDCNYLYLHYLDQNKIRLAKQANKKIKIVWIFWGGDGYALNKLNRNYIVGEETKNLLIKAGLYPQKTILSKIKKLIRSILLINTFEQELSNFLRRIDYCATWVKGDYDLVKKHYPYFNAKFLEFAYINPLQLTPASDKPNDNIFQIIRQPYIITGNSANPSNNHIEMLQYLKKENWQGQIICPLSYSGSQIYVDRIIELGKELFSDNFIPIIKFLDKASYNYLIKNTTIFLINHLRQQAAANLMSAIRLEIPILALSNNTLIQTFKTWGITITGNINGIETIDTKANKQIIENKMSERNIEKYYNNLCFQEAK